MSGHQMLQPMWPFAHTSVQYLALDLDTHTMDHRETHVCPFCCWLLVTHVILLQEMAVPADLSAIYVKNIQAENQLVMKISGLFS